MIITRFYSFSFSLDQRWHRGARETPYALHPVFQQSPQGYPQNDINVFLAEHRAFLTSEGGRSAAPFLHPSALHNDDDDNNDDRIDTVQFEILQSHHCAANCIQHVRSSGQDAIVCKSRATHRALIACSMSCTT